MCSVKDMQHLIAPLLETANVRWNGLSPELAAYVRTELGGDISRIRVSRPPRPAVWTRLRYWLNSFRGFATFDVRGEQV